VIELIHMDCMDYMRSLPDNAFELAIVDPPYGIGIDGDINIRKPDRESTWDKKEKYIPKKWDDEIPKPEYFEQLKRVSKNQIIWGGNYFTDYLIPSKCWVFWNKLFDKTFNFSHGELAWTSFNSQLKMFTQSSKAETKGGKNRIHPTQKPVKLYQWLLSNYAKPGDRILDTHLGSGSSAIAAHYAGHDFVGIELYEDYFKAAKKRFEENTKQIDIFSEAS